jgi:hypothetical protein
MKAIRNGIVAAGLLLAAGCASYYQITDPTTGKVYFSTSMDQSSSGATVFTDAKTGAKITLQNSEVSKITQQQFEDGKSGMTPATMPSK